MFGWLPSGTDLGGLTDVAARIGDRILSPGIVERARSAPSDG
jgi:hypothetical protein